MLGVKGTDTNKCFDATRHDHRISLFPFSCAELSRSNATVNQTPERLPTEQIR
jgi:hypothetical protein